MILKELEFAWFHEKGWDIFCEGLRKSVSSIFESGRETSNNKRTTWKYVNKFKERKQHIKQMKTSQNKEPRSKTERRDNKTNIKLPEVACKITLKWSWVGLSAPPKAFYWRCFQKKRPLKSHPIFSQKILDRTPIWIWRSMVVYCKSCCSHLRSAVLPQMKRNWTEWFRMEPLCYFVGFSLQNWHNQPPGIFRDQSPTQ